MFEIIFWYCILKLYFKNNYKILVVDLSTKLNVPSRNRTSTLDLNLLGFPVSKEACPSVKHFNKTKRKTKKKKKKKKKRREEREKKRREIERKKNEENEGREGMGAVRA